MAEPSQTCILPRQLSIKTIDFGQSHKLAISKTHTLSGYVASELGNWESNFVMASKEDLEVENKQLNEKLALLEQMLEEHAEGEECVKMPTRMKDGLGKLPMDNDEEPSEQE
eukprot:Gb_04263 [translate_table: standard]